MADVLNLQDEQPEAPGEDKRSLLSLMGCAKSFSSIAFCWTK